MIITKDIEPLWKMALDVDFLSEWERYLYLNALIKANEWGKKVKRENEEYFKKNHFIDKYNI